MYEFSTAMEILDVVQKTYVPNMQDVVIDGVKIQPPKPLPWYPDNLGWQVNAPRLVIKKSPEFQKFHKFMVTETEAVSDIYILFMLVLSLYLSMNDFTGQYQ
jgi:multisite-specific tRNA:(cytosine-C5)-methyltransferase